MVNSISLSGFTSFANNKFSFTDGVNIFIGKMEQARHIYLNV